ncbi:MAG: hypothetical protein GY869_08330, partial [Planctomycetes bacterium]|nr:hypothetical protein [Planctomycetota bacterium]
GTSAVYDIPVWWYWGIPYNDAVNFIDGKEDTYESLYIDQLKQQYDYLDDYESENGPIDIPFDLRFDTRYLDNLILDDRNGNGYVVSYAEGYSSSYNYGEDITTMAYPGATEVISWRGFQIPIQKYDLPVPHIVDPDPYEVVPEPVTVDPAPFLFTAGSEWDGTLAALGGSLTVEGGTGSNDRIVVDAHGVSSPGGVGRPGSFEPVVGGPDTGYRITGLGMAELDVYNKPVNFQIRNADELNLDLGDGNDTFTIDGTPEGVAVIVNAAGGDDVININDTNSRVIAEGHDGNDTFNIGVGDLNAIRDNIIIFANKKFADIL